MRNVFCFSTAALIFLAGSQASGAALYSTGNPDFSDAREMTEFVQGANFTLAAVGSFDAIRFWAAHDAGSFAGSISWSIYADNGAGAPGVLIAAAESTAIAQAVAGQQFAGLQVYTYEIPVPLLPLQVGTYWISLHNGSLTNTVPSEFFWMTAAAQSGFKTIEGMFNAQTATVAWNQPQDGTFALSLWNLGAQPIPEPHPWAHGFGRDCGLRHAFPPEVGHYLSRVFPPSTHYVCAWPTKLESTSLSTGF